MVFLLVGVLLMLFFRFIHYQVWKKLSPYIFLFSVLSLLIIYIPGMGHAAGGATRWLSLGSFKLQPIEFVKVFFIIYMAYKLSNFDSRGTAASQKKPFAYLWPCLLVVSIIIWQPDFGAVVLISATTITLLYIAGISIRYVLLLAVVAIPTLITFILIEPYRRVRFLSFLDPWADPQNSGFQIIQSFVAFYRGGLFGVGLGNGKEKIFYLPEAHNDFILSVIAEEIGFMGFLLVCLAFFVLFFRSMQIASRTKDSFGKFLAAGIAILIVSQAFWNASVVLGILPTKGINLPFVSTGGSSIISSFIAIGLLLSISAKNHTNKKAYY